MEHKHSSFLPPLHFLSGNQSSVLLHLDEQGLIPLKCCLKDLGTRIRDFLPENGAGTVQQKEPRSELCSVHTLITTTSGISGFPLPLPKTAHVSLPEENPSNLPNEAYKTRLPFKIPSHMMQKNSLLRIFMPMSITLKSNFRNSRF